MATRVEARWWGPTRVGRIRRGAIATRTLAHARTGRRNEIDSSSSRPQEIQGRCGPRDDEGDAPDPDEGGQLHQRQDAWYRA